MAKGRHANWAQRRWGGDRVTNLRKEYAARLAAGETFRCPFCARPIVEGMAFDLDHAIPLDDHPGGIWDRALIRPAHSRCNRRAGAIAGNKKRAARRRAVPTAPCRGCGDVPVPVGSWLCGPCAAIVSGA